jgi:hypothetical protein
MGHRKKKGTPLHTTRPVCVCVCMCASLSALQSASSLQAYRLSHQSKHATAKLQSASGRRAHCRAPQEGEHIASASEGRAHCRAPQEGEHISNTLCASARRMRGMC